MPTSKLAFAVLALAVTASAQTTWFVDPAGDDGNTGTAAGAANAFRTINHANSVAASGDVVRLAAATFGAEQGIVVLGDKDLTIVGEGSDATTIEAHPTLTTNINSGFPASPVPTQQRPVVLVEGGGRVDFRGVCFDGDFAMPGNGRLVGLYYRDGADGVIEDCEITNCRADPLTGAQGCAGVVVRGDDLSDRCEITLRNCYIHDFGKTGVVSLFNTTLEVEETRVVGAGRVGLGLPAQNGIQVSYDSAGAVRRSTITDIAYDPSSYSAAGILGYDADGVLQIEDCNIGNCETGIYVIGVANTFVPVVIRHNRVHAADYGVTLSGIGGATVADNSFHLSAAGSANAAYDNTSGNSWEDNSYSSYPGVGSYSIPGGGGNVDPNPRRTVDMVGGAPVTTALAAGHTPVDIVVADFDGSGGDDFVTADQNAGFSISIGINTGSGFAVSNLPFGSATAAPIAIVSGEFNGVPGFDVAVLTSQNLVYVFRNIAGIGAFALLTVTKHPSLVNVTDIAAGHVDDDGVTDLVVTNAGNGSGGSAVLLINNGTGSFRPTTLPGSYTEPLRAVTLARLDADNFADIALIEGDASVGRLHLLAGDGAGGFTPFASSPISIGADPTAVAATDLDGDADRDLLVAFGSTPTGGAVDALENDGSGGFTAVRYRTGSSATALAAGNLDSDSDPDSTFGDAAVVDPNGSVTVLGTFVAGAGFGAGGIAASGGTPLAVALGDFDGNPHADLFYCDAATGSVVVLPAKVQARVDSFGFGCPGTKQRIPNLRPTGLPVPTQPNPGFGLEVTNALPASLTGIVVCAQPAAALVPCLPQIDLGTQLFAFLVLTDGEGAAGIALPLVASPDLAGAAVFCQAAVLDPEGAPLFGLSVAMSRGLKLRLGD